MADAFAELLDAIVTKLVVVDAQKDIDLNASADESAEAIFDAKQRIEEDARDRAASLEPAFRQGLILAYEAQGTGHPEIRLEDRDPNQNAIADALIMYLVGFDLAESRSEEVASGHYDYFVAVTWDALYQFADSAGIDLPAALARSSTIPGG